MMLLIMPMIFNFWYSIISNNLKFKLLKQTYKLSALNTKTQSAELYDEKTVSPLDELLLLGQTEENMSQNKK